MPTLKDVAQLAGVSITTASRALNGAEHPVSSDVLAKVRLAADSLGYAPSAAARALKNQKSKIVGVIVSDILDPYFAEVTRGVELEAASHGFVTIVANASRDPQQERNKFRVLREHQASGIVFCGSDIEGAPGTYQLAMEVNAAIRDGTRVVALAPRSFQSTTIVADNADAARELTRYLISLGHRRVVFVGGIPGLVAAEQRAQGYQQAMREAGLTARVAGFDGMSQESGKRATAQVTGGELPDAIICANDEVAVGAVAHLWQARIAIPQDVSLACIGGTRSAQTFDLTAMTLPLIDLGRLAARLIAAGHVDDHPPAAPSVTLRVGATTRPRS